MIYSLSPFNANVKNSFYLFVVSILLLVSLTGCDKLTPGADIEQSSLNLQQSYKEGNSIEIAVVWNKDTKQFRDGAILAAEEINASGGINGHLLKLHFTEASSFLSKHHYDRSLFEGSYRNAKQLAGADIAHRVVARNNISAVITADIPVESALASMVVYQKHGILVMNAGSSSSSIDWLAKDLYFQILPPNKVLAKNIAAEIKRQKWKTIFIAYEENPHETEVIELIRSELVKFDIELAGTFGIHEAVGNSNQSYLERLKFYLGDLRTNDTDAIILLMPPELSAKVIRFSRTIKVLQPFLLGGAFTSYGEFINIVGEKGIGMRRTTLLRSDDYQINKFKERFNKRFSSSISDVSAMLGYDSIRLYAQGVALAGSVLPIRVSEALNFRLPIWYGLFGSYSFSNGESDQIDYSIQKLVYENEKLKFVIDDKVEATKSEDKGIIVEASESKSEDESEEIVD